MDLSDKNDKFIGLNPECHTYKNASDFHALLSEIKEEFDRRIKLYNEGQSLERHPVINLIFYNIGKLSEEFSKEIHSIIQ